MSAWDANGVEIRVGDRVMSRHGSSDVVYIVTQVGGIGYDGWIRYDGSDGLAFSRSIVEQSYRGVVYRIAVPDVSASNASYNFIVLLDDPKEFTSRIPV